MFVSRAVGMTEGESRSISELMNARGLSASAIERRGEWWVYVADLMGSPVRIPTLECCTEFMRGYFGEVAAA